MRHLLVSVLVVLLIPSVLCLVQRDNGDVRAIETTLNRIALSEDALESGFATTRDNHSRREQEHVVDTETTDAYATLATLEESIRWDTELADGSPERLVHTSGRVLSGKKDFYAYLEKVKTPHAIDAVLRDGKYKLPKCDGSTAEKGTFGVVYAYWCFDKDDLDVSDPRHCNGLRSTIRSALTLREHSPLVKNIAFFTNVPINGSSGKAWGYPFSTVINAKKMHIPSHLKRRLKIPALCSTPYERTLYLDSDTFVLDELVSLFSVLDDYEMGLTPRTTCRVNDFDSGVQDSYNAGMLLYLTSRNMMSVLRMWQSMFVLDDSTSDQEPLYQIMRFGEVRPHFVTLPHNYNLRPKPDTPLFSGPAKMLHSHDVFPADLEGINDYLGSRIFRPGKGIVYMACDDENHVWLGRENRDVVMEKKATFAEDTKRIREQLGGL